MPILTINGKALKSSSRKILSAPPQYLISVRYQYLSNTGRPTGMSEMAHRDYLISKSFMRVDLTDEARAGGCVTGVYQKIR